MYIKTDVRTRTWRFPFRIASVDGHDDEIVLNSVLVKRTVSRPVGCSKDQKRSFRRKRVEITRLTMALFIYKLFQDMSGDQQ